MLVRLVEGEVPSLHASRGAYVRDRGSKSVALPHPAEIITAYSCSERPQETSRTNTIVFQVRFGAMGQAFERLVTSEVSLNAGRS